MTHEISHDLLLKIYGQSDPQTRALISAEIEALIPPYTGIKTLDDARKFVADTPVNPTAIRKYHTRNNALSDLGYLHMGITNSFVPDWKNGTQEKWAIILKDYALTGARDSDNTLYRPYGVVRCDDWQGPEATMFPFFFPTEGTANHFMEVGFDLILTYFMP